MTPLALAAALVMIAGGVQADPVCRSPGVIDGDTIRCDGHRVRLWGINAPEAHTSAGPASTRFLAALTTGQTVRCTEPPSGQLTDRYGRLVRRCFVGKSDLAEAMVRAGQAADWPRYSGGFYSEGKR